MSDPDFRAGQTNDGGTPICGAKTRSGKPCQKPPAKGRTRCRMHGGATPVGPDSPNWRHGRHSRYIDGRFLEAYDRAMNDPDILSVASEMALTDARVADLLSELADGGSPVVVARELTTALGRLDAAIASRDQTKANAAIADIRDVADAARRVRATWAELAGLIESRRRLAETERRRIEAAQATITVGELATIVSVLLADARAVFDGGRPSYSRLLTVWRARLGPATAFLDAEPKGD